VHTAWLDQHAEDVRPPDRRLSACVAAWVVAADSAQDAGPFGVGDGWRLAGPPAELPVRLDGEVYAVGAATVRVGNDCVAVRLVGREGPLLRVEVDGVVLRFVVEVGRDRVQVAHRGHTSSFVRTAGSSLARATDGSDGTVLAPMPGTVLRVEVATGDRVEEGQLLGVVEAMKMELALRSPYAGTVTVATTAGATVRLGDRLFAVEGR
jgi:acetyl/propionyl-CoA carboxylase alpha subunit